MLVKRERKRKRKECWIKWEEREKEREVFGLRAWMVEMKNVSKEGNGLSKALKRSRTLKKMLGKPQASKQPSLMSPPLSFLLVLLHSCSAPEKIPLFAKRAIYAREEVLTSAKRECMYCTVCTVSTQSRKEGESCFSPFSVFRPTISGLVLFCRVKGLCPLF